MNGLMAAGAGIMEGPSNELGPAAMALLENDGRIKHIPAGAGTLARTNHSQVTATTRAFVLAEQDPKIIILNLFLKAGYPRPDSLEVPQ